MQTSEILEILIKSNALEHGVELDNGVIAEQYPVMDRLLEDPIVTNRFVVDGFQRFDQRDLKKVKAILSTEDDKLFGFSAATAAWARFVYADVDDGEAKFEHGFELGHAEGVLIVASTIEKLEDVIALAKLVEASGAKLIGVLCLANFCGDLGLSAPVVSLI
jgi:hypothetical protein